MNLEEKISIHNRFDIEVVDAKTGKIKQQACAYNVILDRLYDTFLALDSGDRYFAYVFYGSGSGTPSHTDTTLFHHEGTVELRDTPTYENDSENCVASCMRVCQLSETMAVGVNLTEVGIGSGAAANKICTHALLQDMNGNPISILKTDTDIINIYAKVFIHWASDSYFTPMFDQEVIGGYYGTDKYAGIRGFFGIYNSSISAAPGNMWPLALDFGKFCLPYDDLNYYSGSQRLFSNLSFGGNPTFTRSGKSITIKFGRLTVEQGNVHGLGFLSLFCIYRPQIAFPVSAFFDGTDITGEAVGTGNGSQKRFALDFDMPENAQIYVDGVRRTDAVVSRVPEGSYNLGVYVAPIYDYSTEGHLVFRRINAQDNSTSYSLAAHTTIYNDAYGVGFASITNNDFGHILGSNDLVNWTELADEESGTVTLTGSAQHYKYIKNSGTSSVLLNWNENDGNAIEFTNAPANGAVITANYHTPYIGKDENHVLDLTVTYTFGEWSD